MRDLDPKDIAQMVAVRGMIVRRPSHSTSRLDSFDAHLLTCGGEGR